MLLAGETRPDDETVESLNDAMDETGIISGSIVVVVLPSSSSSLLVVICVSSLQDRSLCDLRVFIWGSNALTYLDVGRFHMMDY